jgi:hypothetical protein
VIAGVLAGAAAVNSAGDFYPTLDALVPATVTSTRPLAAAPAAGPDPAGHGRVVRLSLPGTPRPAVVYLPAAHRSANLRFAVVHWVSDQPVDRSPLPALLDAGIRAGHLPPVVVVQTPDGVAAGALRRWATESLPVRTDRMAWALAGPPGSGVCALDAAHASSEVYAVAAGRACGRGPAGPAPQQLLATALENRSADVGAADALHAQPPPGGQVTEYVFPPGEPADVRVAAELQWIGGRLPDPVAEAAGGGDVQR